MAHTKRFWVQVDPFDARLVTAALEAGADGVAVPPGHAEEVKRLGRIPVISDDGDLRWGRDLVHLRVETEADEAKATPGLPHVVENGDWSIIPLENLISRGISVIQQVENAEQAAIALEVMEQGAAGVFLDSRDGAEIRRVGEAVRRLANERVALHRVRIVETRSVPLSDRCCIDTATLLPPGTGLLVGNSADAQFLVFNENVSTPYCAPRPFRVNAGAVHAYVRLPHNLTSYLCELKAGDLLLGCDESGQTQPLVVGRNKIERRPMLLVRAESKEGREVALILQNAETVRLTAPDGGYCSVTQLKLGDEVLAYLDTPGGRHFGRPIEETIQER
jgi:3-dehydroquinate synthase II